MNATAQASVVSLPDVSDNTNLALWDRAKKTPVEHTKPPTNAHPRTSIATLAPILRATELWGPIGVKWGYRITGREIVDGIPIMFDAENRPTLFEKIYNVTVSFWVQFSEGKSEIEHEGSEKFVYLTGSGKLRSVHDYKKKALSDALKKAMTLYGFNADVHLGDHDDIEYVNELRIESGVAKDMQRADDAEKWNDEKATAADNIKNAANVRIAHAYLVEIVTKAKHRGEPNTVTWFNDLFRTTEQKFTAPAQAESEPANPATSKSPSAAKKKSTKTGN